MFVLTHRVWGVISGAVTIVLVPKCLTSEEQGYFYTMLSGIGLQVFFELGLSQLIVQIIASEASRNKGAQTDNIQLTYLDNDRIFLICQFLKKWYFCAAIAFASIGGYSGYRFMQSAVEAPNVKHNEIWCLVVTSVSINLWISHKFAILEGVGLITEVTRNKLIQSILGSTISWVTIMLGGGLWSLIVAPSVSAIISLIYLVQKGVILTKKTEFKNSGSFTREWYLNVFPLQCKIALSWISGYFIFNLLQLVAFKKFGSQEAGKLGLALSIFSAISTVGLSWVNVKYQRFVVCVTNRDYTTLNSLFNSVFLRSIIFVSVSSLFMAMLASQPFIRKLIFAGRIGDWKILIPLAFATIANSTIFALATYMRSFRVEPMLPVSIVSSVSIILAINIGAKVSLNFMVVLYSTIPVILSLPWTLYLFNRYRRDCFLKTPQNA